MADWNQLLEDPLFNAGLGLLGGAATPNPWGAAADQLNKYQTLRQNREFQQMHSKLYEAQAKEAQQKADRQTQVEANWQNAVQTEPDPEKRRIMQVIGPDAWSKGVADQYFEKKKRTVVAPGSTVLEGDTPIYSAPDRPPAPPAPSEVQKILSDLRDPNIPPSEKSALMQRLRVLQTVPGTMVKIENYPQPMPAINPQTGKVELTQFGSRGSVNPTGYQPAPPPTAPDALTDQQRNSISKLDQEGASIQGALDAVKKSPAAFGPREGAPYQLFGEAADAAANAKRPAAHVEARSLVFNNVSSIIKERAGTAQSVQEQKKIMSFLPSQWDDSKTIETKLSAYNKFLEQQRSAIHIIPKAVDPSASAPIPAAPAGGKRYRLKPGANPDLRSSYVEE